MAENQHWQSRLTQSVGRCFGRPHDPQAGPVWASAEHAYLFDVEGKKYLDFRCGYSAINFGHTPDRLIEAAERQMRSLSQLTQLPSTAMIEFAEELLAFLGWQSGLGKVLFNVSGARAVETALKIALRKQRGAIVCFEYGYHGRSLATQPFSDAATFSADYPWPGIWNGDIYRFPYPTDSTWAQDSVPWADVLQRIEDQLSLSEVPLSAILIEPMLGARGYIAPPNVFFQELQAMAHRFGGLIIADEIQVGLGRGGGRLMSHTQGWQPDLVVLGKSLGGGLVPISAVVGKAELIDSLPNGSESETFAAHPLACAIGSAALRWLIEIESMLPSIGESLRAIFREIQARWNLPFEVQGRGVVAVLDWRGCWPNNTTSNATSSDVALTVSLLSAHCLQSGLLLHPSGPRGTRMVFLPPLTVTTNQLAEGGQKFEAALANLLRN